MFFMYFEKASLDFIKEMIMGIGVNELLLVLLIIVLLFGAKKIPELAKGLGNGMKEFRKATKDEPVDPAAKTDEKEGDRKTGA